MTIAYLKCTRYKTIKFQKANEMMEKINISQIKAYLSEPSNERPFAYYQEKLLDPFPAFAPEEVEHLVEIVKLPVSQYTNNQISQFLIDFSWASSYLEGNTYTQLETQSLIEYGARNDKKGMEDAAMILNHKHAINRMFASLVHGISGNSIIAIQSFLADDRLAPGSKHFLEPCKCGVIRTYTEDGLHIHGSNYLPPQAEDRGESFIAKEFSRLVDSANALPDPINQSFFLMTRIPYLRPFYDANKRTSRIVCNIPLANNGLSPITFVGFEKPAYLEGLLAFYELGDEQLMKAAYTQAYITSALRYLPLGEEARIVLSENRKYHIQAACHYVFTGEREETPAWLLALANEKKQRRSRNHRHH